jgi:hypothetical protein
MWTAGFICGDSEADRVKVFAALAAFVVFTTLVCAQESRVFSVPPGAPGKARGRIATGDGTLKPALGKLVADAERALKQKPLSVTEKPRTWPGVDKKDYFSTAPYFWPNPDTKDGLPYVRKDGFRNPESGNENSDSPRMGRIMSAAETLAFAYYFTTNEAYAQHAAKLLRVWFLDAGTRMNPNLDHAQAIPGVNTGRGIGMIESRSLTSACDAIALLRASTAWSKSDDEGFTKWMRAYLDWCQTSKNGRDEAAAKNNHGVYYDLQVTHFALFVGETNLARRILEQAKTNRIAAQIESDGKQPLELAREDSFGYSRFNLQAMFDLAVLGEHAGVDLWRYQAPGGASIRNAFDFLVAYAEEPSKPWPYERSKKQSRLLGWLPRRAFVVYRDERYRKLIPQDSGSSRDALFWPVK